ncbi:2-dehydropantoate 2-reductase [Lederbergia lenta]|uniref:2-dehydropantoate 2-reductase n=1 Tax=Lederbergia lenta TaxID=1467 RepID=UPI0009EEDF1C|nr:2-dehydropantoate 2-reductase [Lederbergia lenta]MCM3110249.1 2-dehydropantoate 2-reductase [Lederbergia lenta]MEC2324183.1 2-dehydropantoate 2-reductase [Lederbergia lenta]
MKYKCNKKLGEPVNIGIIGGGAVGLLFAAYYGEQHNVVVYCKRKEQAQKITTEGIKLKYEDNYLVVPVSGKGTMEDLKLQELIIIAVKQHQLESLLPLLRTLPRHIPLLFIQNGMGHVSILQSMLQKSIFVGTIEHGAVRMGDRAVSHNGIGKTNIAVFKGGSTVINTFPLLENPLFPVVFNHDYLEMLEAKLIANAVINPLTTLFRVKNGELITNPSYYEIFKQLYHEILKCFPKWDNHYIDDIIKICVNTSKNTSSMLKDMTEGRKTEIEAILGYIVDKGKKESVDIPVARFVYRAIIGMEIERGIRAK